MKNRQALQPSEGTRRRPDKRLLDLFLILMILPLAIPLLLLLALAVWCMLGSPLLFKQQRPGLYGIPFTILKFRTMTNGRDEAGQLLPDSQRVTRFGRFLRSTSLDELPELLNVLRGDMSLVGPRPLLMEYLEHYTPELQRRHHVLPGITGWAQLNGRNTTTWEQRFALDLWYVDHQSLGLDLQIILRTPWKVFKREGFMHSDSPSWGEKFKGLPSKRHPQAARERSAFREEGK
jgi:sugar transferase EpsL